MPFLCLIPQADFVIYRDKLIAELFQEGVQLFIDSPFLPLVGQNSFQNQAPLIFIDI